MSNSNSPREKEILVTGGAGFIGSNLVEKLLSLSNKVVVLDDLSSGRLENLPTSPKLSFVNGDVRDFALVEKLVSKAEVVFHLAEYIPNTQQFGAGHVIKFSMQNPVLDLDICVRGTLNVLEASRKANSKVIFTSSAAVYGEPFENPIKETTATNPISPYGASKLAAEIYCSLFNRIHNVPVAVARLFNVYGPRQRKYIMYDVLSKLEKNPVALNVLGSGNQKRDFVYVDDAVAALIFLSATEAANGGIFNLGTGTSTTVKEVIACITNLLGVTPSVEYTGASWKGDIDTLVADPTKLRRMGFASKYTLKQGLKKFISWYNQTEKLI